MITDSEKVAAFDLMSELGMVVENRRHHSCAQIGHVHYGYARFRDYDYNEKSAMYHAIIECADSYYSRHPEERPNE